MKQFYSDWMAFILWNSKKRSLTSTTMVRTKIFFKWTLLMLEEVLRGVLFTLLFTLLPSRSVLLGRQEENSRWGSFPITGRHFHVFEKVTSFLRCISYDFLSIGEGNGSFETRVYVEMPLLTFKDRKLIVTCLMWRCFINLCLYWCLGSSCLWKEQ